MDSPTDIRLARACLRLDALLRDEAQSLAPLVRRLLRELVAARGFAALDRRALVEAAALVLSELVDQGGLSDETADRLWLALAGCAQSQYWVSRTAAETCINPERNRRGRPPDRGGDARAAPRQPDTHGARLHHAAT